MAAERCAEILVGYGPEGVGRCFVRWEHIPTFDAYCAVSSLPGVFKTELASIPAAIPYLRSDATIVRQRADRLEPTCGCSKLRVGVVWAGRRSHPRDRLRSVRWTELQALERIPGVALIALQKDIPVGDRPDLARSTGLIDVAAALTDFSETAAALENIDLLVAVESAVAHLAGARLPSQYG